MFESISQPKRSRWKPRLILAVTVFACTSLLVWVVRMTQMPLRSFAGSLLPFSDEEGEIGDRLASHTKYLSEVVGVRNIAKPGSLEAASAYLRDRLQETGYAVTENSYQVDHQTVSNLEVTLPGSHSNDGTVLIGAHYDSVVQGPGANDNATGVAALLELARLLRQSNSERTSAWYFSSMKSLRSSRPTRWEAGFTPAIFSTTTLQCRP